MKNSSKSIKDGSNGDDDARKSKRKSKKRRRDRSLSYSSSDSDDAYTKRKRRRKEAKRKKARGSSSDEDFTLRRKGRKKSRKSEGEYRKKSSKVKQKRRTKTRARDDSSGSSTSDYSSGKSCSTCRSSYNSEEECWHRRSKREEFVNKGGSKRGELKKKEPWKGSGREMDRHSSRTSSSCSKRANRADVTDDARTVVRKGIGDHGTDNEGFVVARFCENGVSGEDDKCQANREDGAEDVTQGKYIDENERWEMGADNDTVFGDSSNITKLNPERGPENVDSPHAPNIMHDGRDCSTNSHRHEIGSKNCGSGNEVGTTINVKNEEESDLEAILRQKALENLKRFQGKHLGKTQALVKHHADGGGHTLSMGKTVNEGTHRTSSIRAGSTAEGISDSMPETGHTVGIPGVEDGDSNRGKTLSNYPVPLRARSIVSSIRNSTVCNNEENNNHSNVTEAKKAGGAGGNKNSTVEQSFSQKIPHQAAVSKATPTTMSTERETLRKESIVKSASTSESKMVHDLEASGTDRVPSVASGCSDSVKSNLGQTESKSMTTEASQYEQKTMSVMRGGEMVQVSYKVYIPKRAPALARRQLRR
ncbi:unnamed protein product [Victoria cruziana]